MNSPDPAYECGYNEPDLLANPYPDGSIEARRFVDGWVQRIINQREGTWPHRS